MEPTAWPLSAGALAAAAAASFPAQVGNYLFLQGADDFRQGCEQARLHTWLVPRLMMLKWLLPLTAAARILFAPALWQLACPGGAGAVARSFQLLWLLLLLVPFGLFAQVLLLPGVKDVLSAEETLGNWPGWLPVQRPYQGLLSTRCWACCGGFLSEACWALWLIFFSAVDQPGRRFGGPRQWAPLSDESRGPRFAVGGLGIAIFLFCAGMIAGGPLNFLAKEPYVDQDIAQVYIWVTVVAVEAYLFLLHTPFSVPRAVDASLNHGPFGPFSHWSVVAFNVVLVAHNAILRLYLRSAEELKSGPPWTAGGAPYKEFYFPRFWGLIFFLNGTLLGFNLWVLGCWLSSGERKEVLLAS